MEINVVDAVMGAGKTSAAINYIRNSPGDEHFIYITPFLREVNRIIASCPNKHFEQPKNVPQKIDSLKWLLSNGRNIVTTHALFQMFDQEVIDLCYSQNYILFMDEVADVVEPYTELSNDDLTLLLKDYVDISSDGMLIWKEGKDDYNGRFDKEKRLCSMNCLTLRKNKEGERQIMIWMFPVSVFKAFQNSYVLTYMFDAQMQKYYYDYYGLEYHYLYIAGDSIDTYHFAEDKTEYKSKYNYKKLINIIDNPKLNRIGDVPFSLSVSWYNRNNKGPWMKVLKNNVTNFFIHIVKTKSSDCLWTTFKLYKPQIQGKGYTKGFLSSNARATNDFADRHNVAYLIDKYFNPLLKQFFSDKGIIIEEDKYALSEMLQFIWRSAIRQGEPINLYIPSKRMRNLLISWIDENSKEN